MAEKLGPAAGGLGSRRPGHRFVVVVYGAGEEDDPPWPGHVVHIPATVEATEVRVPFDQVERLPGLLRELIRNATPTKATRSAG